MKRPFFRVGDTITVHNIALLGKVYDSNTARGRVICTNRRNKYGLCVIILYEVNGGEMYETFTADGKRVMASDKAYITLGWKDE